MESINRLGTYRLNPLLESVKQRAPKIFSLIPTVLDGVPHLHNIHRHLIILIATPSLAYLGAGSFLKWKSRVKDKDVEREKENFENLSYKMMKTARVVALAILGLLPFTLYLSLKNGLQALQNRSLKDTLVAIKNFSGALGFLIPLSEVLWKISSHDILKALHEIFHLRFSLSLPEQGPGLLETMATNYALRTDFELPRIAEALGLSSNCDNYALIDKCLISQGLATVDDLKTHGIHQDPTTEKPSPNWGEALCNRLVVYLDKKRNNFVIKHLLPLTSQGLELYLNPANVSLGIIFFLFVGQLKTRYLQETEEGSPIKHESLKFLPFTIAVHSVAFRIFYTYTFPIKHQTPLSFLFFYNFSRNILLTRIQSAYSRIIQKFQTTSSLRFQWPSIFQHICAYSSRLEISYNNKASYLNFLIGWETGSNLNYYLRLIQRKRSRIQ